MAISTENHEVNTPRMLGQGVQVGTGDSIPQLNCVVCTATRKHVAISTENHEVDIPYMPPEDVQDGTSDGIR